MKGGTKMGEIIMKENFEIVIPQNFGFHTNSTHLVFSAQFSYFLNICPHFKHIMEGILCSNNI